MAPPYISDLIHFQSSEFYNLRSIGNNDMMIPRHNTELFKRSFQYSGPQLWNNLPHNLRTATSLPSFKHNLYSFIVSKRCY